MRITLVNQFYPPDISPTGRLAASLAESRARAGDEVTVVAGRGYATCSDEQPASIHSRIQLLHVYTAQLGTSSTVRRCIDYLVFFILASWRLIRLKRQDVIICLTTPPFVALVAVLHKVLHPGTRLILWNMDCYPEVVERGGIIKSNSLTSRLLQMLDRCLTRRIDHIVCLDEAMRSLVSSRYACAERCPTISVIPNWEPLDRFPRTSVRDPCPLQPDEFVVLYAGNMGYGHCLETLIDTAEQFCQQDQAVQFLLIGGGVRAKALQQAKQQRQIHNLTHLGYVAEAELKRIRARAGCVVVTLRNEMLGVMSPSKLHGSLAMGLPILYVGPRGSNVDDAVRRYQCGVSLRHGDTEGFAGFVNLLRSNPSALRMYSRRARHAFEAEYNDRRTLPRFDQVIRSVIDRSDRHAA